jgi:hypothetical protein
VEAVVKLVVSFVVGELVGQFVKDVVVTAAVAAHRDEREEVCGLSLYVNRKGSGKLSWSC